MSRRALFTLGLLVLAGAAVSVAVAWVVAAPYHPARPLEPATRSGFMRDGPEKRCAWWVAVHERFGNTLIVSDYCFMPTVSDDWYPVDVPRSPSQVLPAWSRIAPRRRPTDTTVHILDREHAFGWPCRPIMTGFLADSSIYAALLGAPLFGLIMIRRWRRARNGRWPACGYARSASPVCTECGWKSARPRVAPR